MDGRHESGRRGEQTAEAYLRRRGWTILARRWRGAGAEIDLIGARGDRVVAFEVKTRGRREALDEPLTRAQRERIVRGLRAYVAGRPELAARDLDIDLLTVLPGALRWRVRHVPGVVR